MKVKISYANNDVTRFVPRAVLAPVIGERKKWLTINEGQKPPTPCEVLLTSSAKLALDGEPIELLVGDAIEVRKGDHLSIEGYTFYVFEVDKTPLVKQGDGLNEKFYI